MTPEELVAATAAPIGALGALFYFDPQTVAHGKENLDLDGFRFYILGRGGVLGNTSADAVASAFGYFEPGLIAKMWDSAAERCDPSRAATEYLQCNAKIGRDGLTAEAADYALLEAFCDAAEASCASVNPAGLSLYAGTAAQELPADLPGRAMQLAVTHRELRGSQHLAVVVASGLHPFAVHATRRPDAIATFGWPEDAPVPADTADALAGLDEQTDAINAAAFTALSDSQREAFVAGVAEMQRVFKV